jgi:hypothetical protein
LIAAVDRRACAVAIRVVLVAICAGTAVVARLVVAGADCTVRPTPLIAARAHATRVIISRYTNGIAIAVAVECAGPVAVGVGVVP